MTTRTKQGGFTEWQELRDHAITLFQGELPHPATEQDIINAFQIHPDAVAKAIDSIAVDLQAGQIRTGWGVLRGRANQIREAPSSPKVATGRDREKRVARAEAWIHQAGMHFDVWYEVEDELFGERGLLRPYAQVDYDHKNNTYDRRGDLTLIARMNALYDEQRPTGEQIEAAASERAEAWKAQQARIAEALQAAKAEVEAAIEEPDELVYALAGETPPPDETLAPETE